MFKEVSMLNRKENVCARVLLAEDHQAVAEDLRAVLESEFDVIATVGDGYELVAAAETLTPDVIVSNIALRSERYDSPLVRHRST